MGLFKKITGVASQLGGEVVKNYKGAVNYRSPEEIAQDRIKRADKIKILVQCPGGDLEVYDDFVIGYPTQGSLGQGLLMAATGTDNTVFPMMIANLTVSIKETDSPKNHRRLLLTAQMANGKDQTIGFAITPENEQSILNAYHYIIDFQQNPQLIDEDPVLDYKFEEYAESKKEFQLPGMQLQVSAELDAYNWYQDMYWKLARKQAQKVKNAMERRILSYETYGEFLGNIVYEYGIPLIQLTQDICMAKGIYNENEASIFSVHYSLAHNLENRVNELDCSKQNIKTTKTAGVNAATDLSYTKTTAVFGTSKSDVNRAARQAKVENVMTDIKAGLLSNVFTHLTAADKEEIYAKFDGKREDFVQAIYMDFGCMFLTLNKILAKNGKSVWMKTEISETELRTIENMSRPDFPESKIPEFILPLLQKNPYDRRVYSFLLSKYGKTSEISAIMDYFSICI